jgi:hypothetical protein
MLHQAPGPLILQTAQPASFKAMWRCAGTIIATSATGEHVCDLALRTEFEKLIASWPERERIPKVKCLLGGGSRAER